MESLKKQREQEAEHEYMQPRNLIDDFDNVDDGQNEWSFMKIDLVDMIFN